MTNGIIIRNGVKYAGGSSSSSSDVKVVDVVEKGNKNAASSNAVANAIENRYSTTETVIGKWINDKPIYRKVLTGIAYSFTGASWNNTDIDMTGVETLVNIIPYKSGTAQAGYYTEIVSNKLRVYIVSNVNFSWDAVVLEYTKTTD